MYIMVYYTHREHLILILEETKMNGFETMVEMIKNAYISVYGESKWNSLTDTEKHDAVMYIAKDFGKMVGAF